MTWRMTYFIATGINSNNACIFDLISSRGKTGVCVLLRPGDPVASPLVVTGVFKKNLKSQKI